MNETAADRGWGLGLAYRCKPVTKLGFETVIWQFEAMGGVRAHISPAGRQRVATLLATLTLCMNSNSGCPDTAVSLLIG